MSGAGGGPGRGLKVGFWWAFGGILVGFWWAFSRLLIGFWWAFGKLLVGFRWAFGRLLVGFWFAFGGLLVGLPGLAPARPPARPPAPPPHSYPQMRGLWYICQSEGVVPGTDYEIPVRGWWQAGLAKKFLLSFFLRT